MALEAVAALVVAMAALWLVLHPLIYPPPSRPRVFEPVDPDETPKGLAFIALKEIEFDRETGKLSDTDYDLLKAKYTAAALDALRKEQAGPASDDLEAMIAAKVRSLRSASATTPPDTSTPACSACGPRPEADAVFCSNCGRRLPTSQACGRCGAALLPDSKFCEGCGRPVAA
jgi:hypothetical protein